MDFPIKNKGGGKKDGQGQRRTKNTKKKEKQERQLGSSKGTRQKVQNIERSQMKKTQSPKSNKKTSKGEKGGQYVYFPDKNVIQFLPTQQGGKITDSSCSNFKPTMLNREFNCKQPFWKPDCL
jgi:hypothetical protein